MESFLKWKMFLNIQLGIICMDKIDFCKLGHNYFVIVYLCTYC